MYRAVCWSYTGCLVAQLLDGMDITVRRKHEDFVAINAQRRLLDAMAEFIGPVLTALICSI